MYNQIGGCDAGEWPLHYLYLACCLWWPQHSSQEESAVSTNSQSRPQLGVVMPAEVVRLWRELRNDFVTDLEIGIEPLQGPDMACFLRVTVFSRRFDDSHPEGYDYTWASKDFKNVFYSISPNQLFDLLIVARQSIKWVLQGLDDHPPTDFG